jgi:serine/threonine protein kinase
MAGPHERDEPRPVSDAQNLVGQKLGNYRLQRVLGRGNMGAVYLATDEALLRPTAVKVMTWSPAEHDPEAWFLAEARSVARLNHPSVIQIYGVARHGPHCYIAMEYVEGVSADVMVARKGPFAPERATEVIVQLATALELAHVSGIIHRDVKPGNILIKSDGAAKLGDFGMAISTARTEPTVRAGTPHYFAPEIWRGEPASVATDIYALGATYYYLLTGQPPLDGSTITGLSTAHLREEVIPPPTLASGPGAACMRVVQRCMAKAAGDRYESAGAVAWDARGVLRELASPSPSSVSSALPRRAATAPFALREADAGWRARGFRFEPFGELDPIEPPYRGAPFDGLRRLLAAELTASGSSVILAGAPSSGRSGLARSLLAEYTGGGVYIDLAQPASRAGTLIQRIARGFGAMASPATAKNPELEGLLELLSGLPASTTVPLVVVDGVAPATRTAAEVALLVRAARSTRYFNLLAIGPTELSSELGGSILATAVVDVPALTPLQVYAYLKGWLRATRALDAPPLIVTVDAALLAGHRARGNLAQLNAIARQMISAGGSVMTSWDAWTAADRDDPELSQLPIRPALWPTPEVLALINHCRSVAGLADRADGTERTEGTERTDGTA